MLFLLDGKPFQGRGERPWSDPVMVVLPLSATTQQVVVKLELDLPTGRTATLVLPCIAPTQVHHGRHVAAFVAAVAGCFPDAALPPAALTAHEPSRDAVEHELDLPVPPTSNVVHDDQAHHHHAPSDVFVGALRVVSGHELEGAHVPPDVAHELRRVYAGAAWGFVVVAMPAGRTTLALAVTCAAPREGFLFAPTRTGLRYTAEVATRVDGSCGCAEFVPWNTHLITAGTARRGDWAGGGKDPASTLDDMRHRFASGTYKVIVPPKSDWEDVRCSPASLPEVRALFASVALAPPGASAGTACAASGGDHHHHLGLDSEEPAAHARSHSSHGHFGGGGGGGSGGELLPMHGRTALPTEHNLGGHGFLAAEATAGGHAPHHAHAHARHHHHHHHHAHSQPPHATATTATGGGGGCAAAESAASTPSSSVGSSPPAPFRRSPPAPFRRGVSFKGADDELPTGGSTGVATTTTTTTSGAGRKLDGGDGGGGSGSVISESPATPGAPAGEGARHHPPALVQHDVCMGGTDGGGGEQQVSGRVSGGAGVEPPPLCVERRIPGVGCLDVLRQKKVALGPDVDLMIMLDFGHGETVLDE